MVYQSQSPRSSKMTSMWSGFKNAVAEVADKARINIEQALLDEDLGK